MAGPIQLIPWGLLGVLGIKSMGQQPRELAETVNPVLDIADWWLSASGEVLTTAIELAAGAGTVQGGFYVGAFGSRLTVPSGEVWYVKSVTAIWPGAAGDSALAGVFGIGYQYDPAGTAPQMLAQLAPGVLAAATIANPVLVGAQPSRPFRPGSTFGILVPEFTCGAAVSATVSMDFVRCPS